MLQFTVHGAIVRCGSGSNRAVFQPPDRGITIRGGAVGTECDTSPNHFSETFGTCRITNSPCAMRFLQKWHNPCVEVKYLVGDFALDLSSGSAAATPSASEAFLIMGSCLVCTVGDKVTFLTDGQSPG